MPTYTPPFDPFKDVPKAQDYLREGVTGFGEQLRPELMKQIGDTLGGLNRAGALRSGQVTTSLSDIGTAYGNQVGAFAKEATAGGLGAGLQATGYRLEDRALTDQERAYADQRRATLANAIGSALGAGVGFIASGAFQRQGGSRIAPAPAMSYADTHPLG